MLMTILNVVNLKKEFGSDLLFENVTFSVTDRERLAILGQNGCGKTTLLKIILGLENPSFGDVMLPKGITIGYLSQQVIQSEKNTLYEEALLVFENVIKLGKELEDLERQLGEDPTNQSLIDSYGKKQIQFSNMHGYDYPYLVSMMLNKFGFTKEQFDRPINSFSGGEKTKMAFVKLLLLKPNLLILDEPTNHLDVITIEWLENYLKSYEGALIFVSHDRYFINSLSTKIIEIENKKIEIYKGNYDYYVEEKKLRYEQALKAYNLQQKEIAKIKRFIEYYMPKPRFVSRARDRQNKLKHLKIIDKPYSNNSTIKLNFKGDIIEGKQLIKFSNLSLGYNQKVLIQNIDFTLYGRDHLAVIGNNGSGKTTFFKTIMSQLQPLSGKLEMLRNLSIGYIEQHQFELQGTHTLVEEIHREFPQLGEKDICNHLGHFNFGQEDFSKTIDVLSGGEKMRVVLAKIMLRSYDILLLDEPTNHLDMTSKQALICALKDYLGTIVFISHDRYFIDEIANKILFFHNHQSYYYEGNYENFKQMEKELFEEKPTEEAPIKSEFKKKKPHRSLSKIEQEIEKIENKIKKIQDEQFKEENYMDHLKMKQLDEELEQNRKLLKDLEDEYFALIENE